MPTSFDFNPRLKSTMASVASEVRHVDCQACHRLKFPATRLFYFRRIFFPSDFFTLWPPPTGDSMLMAGIFSFLEYWADITDAATARPQKSAWFAKAKPTRES